MNETPFTTTTTTPIKADYTANGTAMTQQASIDDGLGLLFAAGLAMGLKYFRDGRSKTQKPTDIRHVSS